jgi:hypothetical protein
MAAIAQIRHKHSQGRAYYERKIAAGKTHKEALRCLKRRISDAIYARLRADARNAAAASGRTREGNRGTTLSPARPARTPNTGSSDQPLPGPRPAHDPPQRSRRPYRRPGRRQRKPGEPLDNDDNKEVFDLRGNPCSVGDGGRGAEPALLVGRSGPLHRRYRACVQGRDRGTGSRGCGSFVRVACESVCARPLGRTHQWCLRHRLQRADGRTPSVGITPAARRSAPAIAAVPGAVDSSGRRRLPPDRPRAWADLAPAGTRMRRRAVAGRRRRCHSERGSTDRTHTGV